MKMKFPLSIIILLVWALTVTSWLVYSSIQEYSIDANFKEIGITDFHGAELKAWKAGDCYVFGVNYQKQEGHPHGQLPVFFSNCQK